MALSPCRPLIENHFKLMTDGLQTATKNAQIRCTSPATDETKAQPAKRKYKKRPQRPHYFDSVDQRRDSPCGYWQGCGLPPWPCIRPVHFFVGHFRSLFLSASCDFFSSPFSFGFLCCSHWSTPGPFKGRFRRPVQPGSRPKQTMQRPNRESNNHRHLDAGWRRWPKRFLPRQASHRLRPTK